MGTTVIAHVLSQSEVGSNVDLDKKGSMINQYSFEIGVLGGRHPFLRVGKNRPPLVVLPGLSLDYRPPSWWAMSSDALGFHRLSTARTVYVVQRRRGLPVGTTLRDLAEEYAELIAQQWGRADLMGFSCGGSIAQCLALDHPESLDSLILAISGAKLGFGGRDICLRWLRLARAAQWSRLRDELLHAALDVDTSGQLAGAHTSLAGQAWRPDPIDAQDFLTVLSSLLEQDTSRRLPGLSVRTLIVVDGHDLLYPEAALREMASAIPRSTLVNWHGDHRLPEQHAAELQNQVLDFLSDSPGT